MPPLLEAPRRASPACPPLAVGDSSRLARHPPEATSSPCRSSPSARGEPLPFLSPYPLPLPSLRSAWRLPAMVGARPSQPGRPSPPSPWPWVWPNRASTPAPRALAPLARSAWPSWPSHRRQTSSPCALAVELPAAPSGLTATSRAPSCSRVVEVRPARSSRSPHSRALAPPSVRSSRRSHAVALAAGVRRDRSR
jgi:hypothetical protein